MEKLNGTKNREFSHLNLNGISVQDSVYDFKIKDTVNFQDNLSYSVRFLLLYETFKAI